MGLRYNRNRARGRFFPLFSPRELFYGSVPGAWYDPTDLSTLFQDSAGTTPATAVEQPVGLVLDKSQGLALGAELVTNGNFAAGSTGWVIGSPSWSVSAGQASNDGTNVAVASFRQNGVVTAGKWYLVEWDQTTSAGSLRLWFDGLQLIALNISGTGRKTYRALCTSSGSLFFEAVPGAVLSIDNVTVRELAGNHASQSTAASRPTYRARYNLLTYSEEFQNAAWTKTTGGSVTANAAVAPDGTTTADLVYASSTGNYRSVYQATTGRTISVYAKASGKSWVWFINVSAAVACAWFDVSSGTVGTVVAGYTASVQSVGSGWYRCTVTGPSNFQFVQIGPSDADNTPTVTASGTDGILLWGAQSLTAADVTATGNAYQRIAAATVYDTAPIFRPYLAFDGVDDSLATAAINFTSTDKMTVFAGVTKSSDAATAILVELSVSGSANNGAFLLTAPDTAAIRYGLGMRGTSFVAVNTSAAAYTAPVTNVITAIGNIAAPETTWRANGAQVATSVVTLGTGNFGNYPLFIGRRNNTSFPLNGRIYELIVRGAASSTTEIIDTETWVNQRTGGY